MPMPEPSHRLDVVLTARGLARSRADARGLIEAGLVAVDGVIVTKPAVQVAQSAGVEIRGALHPWVSRGGLKLAHGLDRFAIDAADTVALDIGASTGGFTDVLLSSGARKVYAVDVGHGQLDERLRHDPRVVVLERVNARYLDSSHIPEPIDLVVCDVSFISLRVILPAPLKLVRPGGWLLALIKPQFEVGPAGVGKGGIVRDPALHRQVCKAVEQWLQTEVHWMSFGIFDSPIEGSDGNREFLIAAQNRSY